MTDSTWIGVAGIVAIVVVTALFFSAQESASVTAAATTELLQQSSTGETCEPGRFCDGSRLVIVRADCSIAESFCQQGCNAQARVCN